jgi:hypothetical protein
MICKSCGRPEYPIQNYLSSGLRMIFGEWVCYPCFKMWLSVKEFCMGKGNHKHWGIIHTNGVLECYQCGKLIMSKEKAGKYKSYPAYKDRIIVKEVENV